MRGMTVLRPMNTTCAQGLTLVHFSAQHKHILWDTLGARFPPVY